MKVSASSAKCFISALIGLVVQDSPLSGWPYSLVVTTCSLIKGNPQLATPLQQIAFSKTNAFSAEDVQKLLDLLKVRRSGGGAGRWFGGL